MPGFFDLVMEIEEENCLARSRNAIPPVVHLNVKRC